MYTAAPSLGAFLIGQCSVIGHWRARHWCGRALEPGPNEQDGAWSGTQTWDTSCCEHPLTDCPTFASRTTQEVTSTMVVFSETSNNHGKVDSPSPPASASVSVSRPCVW